MGYEPAALARRRRRGGADFDPLTLFATNQAGAWYDASDLTPEKLSWAQANPGFTSAQFLAAFPQHALYQDSAGTTPVTALGQPVGLVLDKSKGGLASVGTELVTNGDFSSGTTGWTAGGTTTLQVTSGVMRATGTTDGAYFGQQISVVSGRTYRLLATFGNDSTSKAGQINLGTALGTANRYSGGFGFGLRQVVYTATATETLWIWFYPGFFGSSNYILVDDVTVREVPGSHAIQATSASRPTLDARVNLLTYSEQFDNAAWTKLRASVTANNATAPDGSQTADTLIEDTTASNSHLTYNTSAVTVANATAYTYSIYAKPSGRSWINLVPSFSSASAYFDVQNGVLGTVTNGTASIVSAGNGWFRCVLTFTSNATSGFLFTQLATANGTNSYTGDGTSGIFVWGADLRLASDAAYPYQRVVTASDYADVQSPRYLTFDGVDDSLYTASSVDFATVTSDGQARRNLLTYPSAFDNSAWAVARCTISANTSVAPDGTTTADTLVEDTTTNSHPIFRTIAGLSATTYTASVFFKAAGRNKARIALANTAFSGSPFVDFDLVAVTATGSAGGTGTITDVGNGWFRCTATATATAGAGDVYFQPRDAAGNSSYTGNGAAALLLWGAQLELGTTATTFQDIGTDKVSVFTGVRKLSDAARGLVFEFGVGGVGTFFGLEAPNTGSQQRFAVAAPGPQVSVFGASVSAPVSFVLTGLSDLPAPLLQLRRDGTVEAVETTSAGTLLNAQPFYIGRRNNASLPFNGRLYQLIVRGAMTDTATVVRTEQWVAGKTGVTL